MAADLLDPLLFLATFTVSSTLAWIVGRHGMRLPAAMLRPAWRHTLECLGVVAVAVVVNVVIGVALVVALRAATGRFVALYAMSDVVVLPLALVQALAFWWWRVLSHRSANGDDR